MVKIEINVDGELTEFNISDKWEEVTVKQSSQLFSLERGESQLTLVVKIVSILSGVDEEIIYMMTQEQFTELIEVIKFTNTEVNSTLKEFIVIDDEEYYLKRDFEQLNLGEIISIETILQQNGDLTKSMAKLLCIFLRKKLDNGELESFRNEFMNRESKFERVIITDVNDLFLFFLDGKSL